MSALDNLSLKHLTEELSLIITPYVNAAIYQFYEIQITQKMLSNEMGFFHTSLVKFAFLGNSAVARHYAQLLCAFSEREGISRNIIKEAHFEFIIIALGITKNTEFNDANTNAHICRMALIAEICANIWALICENLQIKEAS